MQRFVNMQESRKTLSMKLKSVSKFLALVVVLLAPLYMSGKKINDNGPKAGAYPLFSRNLTKPSFEASLTARYYDALDLASFGLSKPVFNAALKGFNKLMAKGLLNKDSILTICDFSKSSREKRLYVLDLKNMKVLFNTFVAHGRGSGMDYARSFSNKPRSKKSSLGFYITEDTYFGSNGYSLRLSGVERGYNDKAESRAIVMHGADYVSENFANSTGHLGRSYGCPAIPMGEHKDIIDSVKNGSLIFLYYNDAKYLHSSKLLNG